MTDLPWQTRVPTSVGLNATADGWRYAVWYDDGGVVEGGLPDTPVDEVKLAQAELAERVVGPARELLNKELAITLEPTDRDGWWTGECRAAS